MSESQTTPKPGQIWQRVDAHVERFVRVNEVDIVRRRALIQTVIKSGIYWRPKLGGRQTTVKLEVFNGKDRGYRYVEA